ncbi:hypothetical protein V8F33_002328, partial [Rhypophila sp. PSN 637]
MAGLFTLMIRLIEPCWATIRPVLTSGVFSGWSSALERCLVIWKAGGVMFCLGIRQGAGWGGSWAGCSNCWAS